MEDYALDGCVPPSQSAPLRWLRMRAVEKNSAKRAKRFPLPAPATPPTRPARVIPFAPTRPRSAAHRRAVGKFRREDDSVLDGESTVCSTCEGRGEAAWFDMLRERTETPSKTVSWNAERPPRFEAPPVEATVERDFGAEVDAWLARNAGAAPRARERFADQLTTKYMCAMLDELPTTDAMRAVRRRVSARIERVAAGEPGITSPAATPQSRLRSAARPRSAGATRPQAMATRPRSAAGRRAPFAPPRSPAPPSRPRSAGATRPSADGGTPLSATRPFSERRFVPRGVEIHAKPPAARHTVQRLRVRPRTADASLRRRITRARPLPRQPETAVPAPQSTPREEGEKRRYFEFYQDMLDADALFNGRQKTFKRYSATDLDERHPRHNARDVLRRRKTFLGYTDLKTPIPGADRAETPAPSVASVQQSVPGDVISECHADGRKVKDYAGGLAKSRYHGMVNSMRRRVATLDAAAARDAQLMQRLAERDDASIGSGPAT
jgi:hypothetical protein